MHSKLILGKIIEILATRCHILKKQNAPNSISARAPIQISPGELDLKDLLREGRRGRTGGKGGGEGEEGRGRVREGKGWERGMGRRRFSSVLHFQIWHYTRSC